MLAQAELALQESGAGLYPYQQLTVIRNVAIRGSEIVRQLMIYAGKDREAPALLDISQIVLDTFELLKVSVSKRVMVVTDLGSGLPPVLASPAQIRQIVMNLITNASDAIGDRDGAVRIATRHVTPQSAQTIARGPAEDHYLQLEVSDTGRGMSPELQTRVFDPFFTTRGAGHGLGLAVVDGIVRSLRGGIQITSEVGHGTTFQIWLPCAERVETARDPKSDASEASRSAQQLLVLVVEDEEPLRQAVISMLEKAGFAVIAAADGVNAIEILRSSPGKIDVVLLDMTIPGASSHDVAVAAAQTCPDIRVIATSAYSQEMLKPAMNAAQIHEFIRKPYRLSDLVQTLRKAASA